MESDVMRSRTMSLLLLTAMVFFTLAWRIVQLNVQAQAIAAQGEEMAAFHPYPPFDMIQELTTLTAGPGADSHRVRVPSVLGETFAVAGPRLLQAGLLTEGYGDIEGEVIRQEPAPGQTVRPGSPVKVWLDGKR